MANPETIYLLPGASSDGETVWCDAPAPGPDMNPADAAKYIRADRHETALRETERETIRRCAEVARGWRNGNPDAVARCDWTAGKIGAAILALDLTVSTDEASPRNRPSEE